MKNHYSLIISSHTAQHFWTSIALTVQMAEDEDVLLKKLSSVKKAFEYITDAKHVWLTDPDVQSKVQRYSEERTEVAEHAVALLIAQLRTVIPANLLSMEHQYLVDLKKLSPEQASTCTAIFDKVDQYKMDRFSEIDQEEQRLAFKVVSDTTKLATDKLAVMIATHSFLEMKSISDKLLENLILRFDAKEILDILKHSGGPALTLIKAPTTVSLIWQPTMLF